MARILPYSDGVKRRIVVGNVRVGTEMKAKFFAAAAAVLMMIGTTSIAEAARHPRGHNASSSHSGVGPRPSAWCGWWMRTQRGGGPELNLAWNWSRWGRPTVAQIGAVVVWPHHVGEIVGKAPNGQWIVRSGNDGGAVRTRARSVAGAVFRI